MVSVGIRVVTGGVLTGQDANTCKSRKRRKENLLGKASLAMLLLAVTQRDRRDTSRSARAVLAGRANPHLLRLALTKQLWGMPPGFGERMPFGTSPGDDRGLAGLLCSMWTS